MSEVERLDILICSKFSLSRSIAKHKIENNLVKVNNKIISKANTKVKTDSEIILLEEIKEEKEQTLKPWKKDIDIVYEDQYILIVNKPNDIIVHPTSYEVTNTLANIIKYIFESKKIKYDGDELRMGIVHRLDKCTEGLLIVAKNKKVFETFTKLFLEHKVEKKYLALLHNHLQTRTVEVDAPIKRVETSTRREVSKDLDAKDAKTIFKEITKYKNFTLAEIELFTGRTHQIRVHAEFIKNNVVNDPIYGPKYINKTTKYGQYLVAYKLKFIHPFTKNEVNINLDMSKEFKEYIKKYGK